MRRAPILCAMALIACACGTETSSVEAPSPEGPGAAEPETTPEPETPEPETPENDDELVDLLHAVETTVTVSSAFHGNEEQVPRLYDGELPTAWNSESENLVGAWIDVQLPAGAHVDHILMTNGFTHARANRDLYHGNHRIRRVRVLRNGEEVGTYPMTLDDQTLQRIEASGDGGTWRIQVVDAVPGDHPTWRELCVSELRVMGTAPDAEAGSTTPTAAISSDAPTIEEAFGVSEGELVDLIHAVPATLRASSVHESSPEHIAAAVDGDTGTAWRAVGRTDEWLEVDLPENASVARIEIAVGRLIDEATFSNHPRLLRVRLVHGGVPLGEYELDPSERSIQTLNVMGSGGTWRLELLELEGEPEDGAEICELRFIGHAEGAEAGSQEPELEVAVPGDETEPLEEEGLALAMDPAEGAIFGEAEGLRVTELAIGGGVENRQIVDGRGTFSRATDTRVYCLVRIDNPERAATGIYMAWERTDRETDDPGRLMNVPAQPRYVTFGFTGTRRRAGRYRCTIRSASQELLGSVAFDLTE